MAETKLTKEQIARNVSQRIEQAGEVCYEGGIIYQACLAAIEDYAAQQQAEHEAQLKLERLKSRLYGLIDGGRCGDAAEHRLAEVEAENERVLAVLREHEGDISCCVGMYEVGRHSSDCWLAALLAADKEAQ